MISNNLPNKSGKFDCLKKVIAVENHFNLCAYSWRGLASSCFIYDFVLQAISESTVFSKDFTCYLGDNYR